MKKLINQPIEWLILSILYQYKSYISFLNAMYLQPDVNDLKDFRFFNELSVLFKINKYLQLNISSVWRYDSHPPLNLEKNDISIMTGIVIRFYGND